MEIRRINNGKIFYFGNEVIPKYSFNAKELDEETRMYYFEARYYRAPTFTSRDPLFEKYFWMSPYAYCANNPVKYIDPTGMIWEDAEGNKITDHSKIKVYIFYDPKSFSAQSKAMYEAAEQKYGKGSVAMSNVTTMDEFAKDWGDMASNDIKEVNLNYHGGPQTINLDYKTNQYLTSTGDGKTPKGNPATNVSDLPIPSGNIQNAQLNINSCRSNYMSNLSKGSSTIAQAFRDNTSFYSIRTTSKGVSYWYWFSPNRPHPQDDSPWTFLHRPIQRQRCGVGLPPK